MAEDDKKDDKELSEDEKLAAEWEAAMEETGGSEESDAAVRTNGQPRWPKPREPMSPGRMSVPPRWKNSLTTQVWGVAGMLRIST